MRDSFGCVDLFCRKEISAFGRFRVTHKTGVAAAYKYLPFLDLYVKLLS